MPPTLIAVAVGVLLGVALLGPALDRRSLAVVAGAAALPDLDVLASVLLPGATNALLHSVWLPAVAAVGLYAETSKGESSWLRGRYGWRGVRIAWVAIAAYAVAGIGLDLFSSEAVALFYPVSGRYYAVEGRFVLSTASGVVQTYVGVADGWLAVESPGTTATYWVDSWLHPADGERRLDLIETGWQAVVLLMALATLSARFLLERGAR